MCPLPAFSHRASLEGLIEDDIAHLALDIGTGDKVTQQARLGVTVDDDDAAVPLQRDGDQGSVGVEGEVAGEAATRGDVLERRQAAGGRVDGEVDDGVGDDGGAVGRVEVGDLVDVLVAGRGDEETLVGLCFLSQSRASCLYSFVSAVTRLCFILSIFFFFFFSYP